MSHQPFILPRIWTPAEIADDIAIAKGLFRVARTTALTDYSLAFSASRKGVEAAVAQLTDFLQAKTAAELRAIIEPAFRRKTRNKHFVDALRYFASPPLADDTLETLLDGVRLNGQIVHNDKALLELQSILRTTSDPHRFPWTPTNRAAIPSETEAAILATTCLMAVQQAQTKQRNVSGEALEKEVLTIIKDVGYELTKGTGSDILLPTEWAKKGTVVRHQTVRGHNGDLFISMVDGRWMMLECKVSNSAINSRKRVNKDVVGAASAWRDIGKDTMIPAVVIQGVFAAEDLLSFQRIPVYIFWGHRLSDLTTFLKQFSQS